MGVVEVVWTSTSLKAPASIFIADVIAMDVHMRRRKLGSPCQSLLRRHHAHGLAHVKTDLEAPASLCTAYVMLMDLRMRRRG